MSVPTIGYFAPESDPKLYRCGCGRSGCDAPPPSPDLLSRLNLLRHRLGRAVVVTSGPRCAWHNAQPAVGGKPQSDHLTGEGADLAAATSRERWQLLAAIFEGKVPLFTRLGFGRDFLHVGVAGRNPGELAWHYYPAPTKAG